MLNSTTSAMDQRRDSRKPVTAADRYNFPLVNYHEPCRSAVLKLLVRARKRIDVPRNQDLVVSQHVDQRAPIGEPRAEKTETKKAPKEDQVNGVFTRRAF
jgi:hypothetical protein